MSEEILVTHDNRTDSDVTVSYDPDKMDRDGYGYVIDVEGGDAFATDEDDWADVMESFGDTRVGDSTVKPQVIEIREGLFGVEVSRVVAGDIMRAIENHTTLDEMIDALDSWFENGVCNNWDNKGDCYVWVEPYESQKPEVLTDHYTEVTISDEDEGSDGGALVHFEIND